MPEGAAGPTNGHDLLLPPLLGGMSVAIVDDQEANVVLLQRILERAGLTRIVSTSDPGQALALIGEHGPDLVCLDLHMPEVDGFMILDELRRRTPATDYRPILVLTADVTPEAKRHALSLGANDLLTKPFDPTEVLLRVRNLLQTRFLHRQLQAQNRALAEEVASRTVQLRQSQRARTDLVGALERVQTRASAEETAEAICEELVGLPGLDAASLVLFTPSGAAVPLAVKAPPGAPLAVSHALPDTRAAYLLERASLGPWVEESIVRAADGDYAAQLGALGFGPGVYAPLRHAGRVVGVLAGASLSPEGEVDRVARLLPGVVDRAAVAAAVLAPLIEDRQRHDELQANLRAVIERQAFSPVFQPIVDLERRTVIGYEALTRFADGTRPDLRFAEAEEVGLLIDLERVCLGAAIGASPGLPEDSWLSLNVSPRALLEPRLVRDVTAGAADRPVVLELTEHIAVPDYEPLKGALETLRPQFRLAIDDAGAGFASFRHIIELEPEFVKLDNGLVRALETDERRQALIAGLHYFAGKTGCVLIAEGIEREEERSMLRGLSVGLGQGFLLGRPAAVDRLADRRRSARPFSQPAA
jgi:EAL domain-containing protein (putative c-di-GMP-specific phosphodiesterase class I)/DNA-binding response OmpR family regulator